MSKSKLITSGYIKSIVGASLFEDQAQKDITTELLVNKNSITSAKIVANEDGIIGGLDFAEESFKQIDKKTKFKKKIQEGSSIKKGEIIAEIKGLTGSILRFNLFDEIFIKDNHISASQNIFDLVQNALRLNRSGKIITVEVDNLTQLETIQSLNFNRLLLDNMKPDEIKKALNMIGNKYETEASGNITEKNIIDYAKTGVNRISIGRLTHSPQNLDISLNFN
ncbi:MAG: nicotinate-nucleotide diphosphorylase (carboxylating) [Candidatus Fonsibacter ubiquis]|nr:nicotinate-nucleotide diphosphorylase (carboxylating) [Candidatus Fonsibacter ubiquis]